MEGISLPVYCMVYYVTIIIETVWYWQGDRYTDKWEETEILEINPPKYPQRADFWQKEQS